MNDLHGDPQNLSLGHLLAHTCRLVGELRRERLERIGLHHAQGMLLFRLWRSDGISQGEIARDLHIAHPTVSSTLKRMERDGWIERRRDADDSRIVRVYLTERSRTMRHDAFASFRALDHELNDILDDGEHQQFRQSLLKVYHYLSGSSAVMPGRSREIEEKGEEEESV